jgi:MFS family permease
LTDIVLVISKKANRGFYMGIFGASFGIGAILGSFYSGFVLAKFGMNSIFVSNIILALCGVCVVQLLGEYHLMKQEKLKINKELLGLMSLYSASILRRVYMFAFTIFLPIYCVQILKMDLKNVANVFGIVACVLVFVGPVAGRMADKMNVNSIIVVCIGVMSFSSLMIFLGFNFNLFFGLLLVFFGITMPANMKLFCDAIENNANRTQVLGIAGSLAEIMMLFIAVAVPLAMTFGVQYVWLFLVACGAVAVVPYLLQKKQFKQAI